MNTTITYDIFELAKDLKKAGINEAATDAIVKFEKTKNEAYLNTLVTKKDSNDLKKDMQIMRRDIIIWLGSINTVLAGIIIAVISLQK
jgi:hypothetical protein